jgi:hypothetical protein
VRQRRERHGFPATVRCGDVLAGVLGEGRYDVITAVGSTVPEAGDRQRFLAACRAALAPGGSLLVAEVGTGPIPAVATVRSLGDLWLACARFT